MFWITIIALCGFFVVTVVLNWMKGETRAGVKLGRFSLNFEAKDKQRDSKKE
jgi:hypothetical protein